MNWFKRHPDWLESEALLLQNDSNYKEKLQVRGNLFISHGEIIVREIKVHRYPILIVYPEATPYDPPSIYILKKKLDDDIIKDLAKLKSVEVASKIEPNIEFLNLRHQNENGSVCFLESDNLYNENAQIVQIPDIIKKVQRWITGLYTDHFPPDSAEVELYYHFKNRDHKTYILLTDVFYQQEVASGEFYATQNRFLPNAFSKTYVGLLMIGQNEKNVSLPPIKYSNEQHILFTECPSIKDIIDDSHKKADLLKEGKIIEGFWWHVDEEPKPFESFDELARLIGQKDIDSGYSKLLGRLKFIIASCEDDIYIGLRFLNRRDELEWIILRLERIEKKSIALLNPKDEEIKEKLNEYKIIAIKAEKFTDLNYHKRNSIRAVRETLKDKNVAVIGCGALGSEIADNMAKAGIGNIILVDCQLFFAHNAVRHLVRLDRTNVPKVNAVMEELILHNPFVNILPYDINILAARINQYLPNEFIGLSSIADDNIEGYLNEQAVIHNKTVYYVRALRGGKAARIFRVIPGYDACKNCLALYADENKSDFINIPEDPSLPTITNECNNPIRPASAPDLKTIASIFSRIVIDNLQKGETDKNHWIWYTEEIEGLNFEQNYQFKLFSDFIKPHNKCTLCQEKHPIEIKISKSAYEKILAEIDASTDIETGGILIGTLNHNQNLIVRFATGPGPNAKREKFRFEKDIAYCQRILEEKYNQHKSDGVYLGEWHYHAFGSNNPSDIDLLSLHQISQQKNYLTDKPIMLIFSKDKKPSFTVHPYNRRYYKTTFTFVESEHGGTPS